VRVGKVRPILYLLVLLLPACATPYPRKVFDLPPCPGTWVCENRRDKCVCLTEKRFEQWKQRNGL
jgi:hypothetical protein